MKLPLHTGEAIKHKAIFMVTYCRQGTSIGVLPLWVWWAQCGTLTGDYQRFGAFTDIFTPEHTDN
ncbi:hypothetical protein DW990_03795 [Phocaeicola vulgatus]|nr:hypothetical protein DW990_03795 [Phocaeicola vulgatus]